MWELTMKSTSICNDQDDIANIKRNVKCSKKFKFKSVNYSEVERVRRLI